MTVVKSIAAQVRDMESRSSNAASRLNPNDFRRLGVRPHEFRLAVIRRAAMLRARAIAVQHLNAPNGKFERKLTRLATSTYRLLDPRQRHDQHHRLLVGRIHPQILHGAGQTCFHNELSDFGSSPRQLTKTPFERSLLTDAELIELLDLESPPPGTRSALPQWAVRLSDADLLESGSFSRRVTRLRTRLRRSPRTLAMAGMLLLALLGVAVYRWRSEQGLMSRASFAQTTRPLSTAMSSAQADADPAQNGVLGTPIRTPISSAQNDFHEAGGPGASSSRLLPAQHSIPQPSAEPLQIEPVIPDFPSVDAPSLAPSPLLSAAGTEAVEERSVAGVTDGQDSAVSSDLQTIDTQAKENSMLFAERQDPEGSRELQNVAESTLDGAGEAAHPHASTEDLWAAIDSIGSLPSSFAPIAKPVPLIDLGTEIVSKPLPLESVRRAAPDEMSLRLARRGLIDLMPSLEYAYEANQAAMRIEQLEWIQQQFSSDSTESWIITHLIAETAWLIESVPQVERRLRELTLRYDVSSDRLLAETFVNALPHASIPRTRSHLIQNGLRLAERLLQQSEAALCGQVLKAMASSQADATAGHDALQRDLDEYFEALEFMERHAEVIDRVARLGTEPERDDAIILGRYYCMILRQWERGVHWLQHTEDPRMAHAVEEELALGEQPTVEQLQGVARAWLIAANRTTGRPADSMRLHAIDLLHRGQAEASDSQRADIDRQLDETVRSIPPHLVPADGRAVAPASGLRSKRSRRPFTEPLF